MTKFKTVAIIALMIAMIVAYQQGNVVAQTPAGLTPVPEPGTIPLPPATPQVEESSISDVWGTTVFIPYVSLANL